MKALIGQIIDAVESKDRMALRVLSDAHRDQLSREAIAWADRVVWAELQGLVFVKAMSVDALMSTIRKMGVHS